MRLRAYAPGRVNLIGDHTDYSGGLVLPMAIDLGTTVILERGGPLIELASSDENEPAIVLLGDVAEPPSHVRPLWARYVAGVAAVLLAEEGGSGLVTSTLPVGAGLASSAALEVAVALALGLDRDPIGTALACQQAEHLAVGVPCGIMDQLAVVAGRAGHAMCIDCATLDVDHRPVPDGIDVLVVHSGQPRELAASAYGVRRAQVEEAEAWLDLERGVSLRQADAADVAAMPDPTLRARARHVVSENRRVREFAVALDAGDVDAIAELMAESHRSLASDFEVSTSALDGLVGALAGRADVLGARLTGAGFGGCVVALVRRGAGDSIISALGAPRAWVVHASDGATVTAA